MVSYKELIYSFADIYLKTAMECSICKESYKLADDTEFLDEYIKVFISLLSAVEKDAALDLHTLKQTLERFKHEKISEFQMFIKKMAIKASMEATYQLEHSDISMSEGSSYIEQIQGFYSRIWDEGMEQVKGDPVELLRYMRSKEENL